VEAAVERDFGQVETDDPVERSGRFGLQSFEHVGPPADDDNPRMGVYSLRSNGWMAFQMTSTTSASSARMIGGDLPVGSE